MTSTKTTSNNISNINNNKTRIKLNSATVIWTLHRYLLGYCCCCCLTCCLNTIKLNVSRSLDRIELEQLSVSVNQLFFIDFAASLSPAQEISEIGFVSAAAVCIIKVFSSCCRCRDWRYCYSVFLYIVVLFLYLGFCASLFGKMVGMIGQVHFLRVYGRKWSRGP